MNENNDMPPTGGPAFAAQLLTNGMSGYVICGGVTIRDIFAGLAMMGDWAAQSLDLCHEFGGDTESADLDASAQLYYRMAAAMLRAREAQT